MPSYATRESAFIARKTVNRNHPRREEAKRANMNQHPRKTFDCIQMKRDIQKQIRALVAGMTRSQEIAFFRAGAEKFEARIEAARQALERRTKLDDGS